MARRSLQKAAAALAIIVPLLMVPYVMYATGTAHLLTTPQPLTGVGCFWLLLVGTFLLGVLNAADPRRRLAAPDPPAPLPRAIARPHVSGMTRRRSSSWHPPR